MPKELLPLVDTPVIDHVVSACAAAGIERIVIVGAPGKGTLEAYFRPSPRLEQRLVAEGRTDDLERLRRAQSLAEIRFVEPTFQTPAISQLMVWHPRSTADPAHRWLRDVIMEICDALDAG